MSTYDVSEKSCTNVLSTGPEIRTGKLKNGQEVLLKAGNKFIFTTDQSVLGDETIVSTTYSDLPNTMKVGDTILVDDGLIGMTVTAVCLFDIRR